MTAPTPETGVIEHAEDGIAFLRAIPPTTPTGAPEPPPLGGQFGDVELPVIGGGQ